MSLSTKSIKNNTQISQFVANIASNVGVYFFNLLIGVWMTPYLIGHLGVALFGLIPLANSVTAYLGLLTLSLNGAIGRFLVIDLQKGDRQSANSTFNTSFVGVTTIALLSIPFLALFSYLVPRVFDIPSGEEFSAQLLFFFVLLSFFITEIGVSFSVSSWAKSRFDLRNRVLIFSNVIRLIVLITFFTLTTPSAWQVGLGILIASLYVLLGDYLLWRNLTPELSIDVRKFDLSRVRQLFSMGGWMIVDQAGSLLLINVDMIVANTILGAKAAGIYGSLLIFSALLRGMAATISSVLTPTLVAGYAKNDFDGITKLSTRAVWLMGLVLSLPVGLLCGLSAQFLGLWLGDSYKYLFGLLILLSFHLAANLSVQPLFGIRTAFNKVKIPGIVTLITGGCNFVLAIILASCWGLYGLALAGAISLTFRNLIFTTLYNASIQKLPWYTYFPSTLSGILGTSIVSGLGYVSTLIVPSPNWFSLILITFSISIIYMALAVICGLNTEEKQLLFNYIKLPPRSHK